MSNSLWDERYATPQYIYGIEPNRFFRHNLDKLSRGRILLPAEGEGRNAVYAAKAGWEVCAFDSSAVARSKALKLADQNGVNIDYRIMDYEMVDYPNQSFDAIALIYAHSPIREFVHRRMVELLKPGGVLILEGFSKHQINFASGGPRNTDWLFSTDELKSDFNGLKSINVWEDTIELDEGIGHKGIASVIRMLGYK